MHERVDQVIKERTEKVHRMKFEAEQVQSEKATFKPEINERSKQMAYLRQIDLGVSFP